MPLQLTSLDPIYREYASTLPDDPTEEQLHKAAETVLVRMISEPTLVRAAMNEIRRIVNARQNAQVAQAANQASLHYTFARPHKSATPNHPVFEQLKVLATEFAQFCREFEVSESGMLKVAHGEVDSFKGWKQGVLQGSLETPRIKVARKDLQGPAQIAGPFFTVVKGKGTWDGKSAPAYLPTTWWHPAD